MDEIPPRARGALATPASRDISRRATARGRDGDARLGWTAIESREFHASRRRGRERGGGRREDARRLIDSFPIAIVLGLIDWFVVDTRGDS